MERVYILEEQLPWVFPTHLAVSFELSSLVCRPALALTPVSRYSAIASSPGSFHVFSPFFLIILQRTSKFHFFQVLIMSFPFLTLSCFPVALRMHLKVLAWVPSSCWRCPWVLPPPHVKWAHLTVCPAATLGFCRGLWEFLLCIPQSCLLKIKVGFPCGKSIDAGPAPNPPA